MRLMTTLAAIAATLALAACSSTSVKDTWKDPQHSGAFKKVMVVGVSKSAANRRVFEDGFTKALQAAGTTGVVSYNALPSMDDSINDKVGAEAAKAGADAVLVTRVLRTRRDVNVSPGMAAPGFYGRGYRGWYGGAWAMAPDVHTYDVLTVESTLWNMKVDKPAWSGTYEVTEPGSVQKATEDIAKALITKMKADGVI